MVKGGCIFKHSFRRPCHIGHFPIVERLVERGCAPKHSCHIRHFEHVPIVERLVEGSCGLKHTSYIPHIGHVPIIERLVEALEFAPRKKVHRFALPCPWNVLVEEQFSPSAFLRSFEAVTQQMSHVEPHGGQRAARTCVKAGSSLFLAKNSRLQIM